MDKIGRLLPVFAFAMFLLALSLPAVITDYSHLHITLRGWEVMCFSLGRWPKVFGDLHQLVVALSNTLNLVFPLLAVAVFRYPQQLNSHLPYTILGVAVMGGLAAWAPYSLPDNHFTLLAGYYLWIAAHVVLLLGLVLRSLQTRASQTPIPA